MPPKKRRNPSPDAQVHDRKKPRKWHRTLRHRGPQFPPPYEKLPGPSKFIYDRAPCRLNPAAEEAAVFYAKYLMRKNRNKTQDKIVKENFFTDWKNLMTRKEKEHIKSLAKCDFREIIDYLEGKAEEKRERSAEEKRQEREQKERDARKYKKVMVDQREEQLANYIVEPPGLFIGRGTNRRMGKIKRRIEPEDITINCDEHTRVQAPRGHRWGAVIHDRTVTWIAKWNDCITGQPKYLELDAGSKTKSNSDKAKYETAEDLEDNIGQIRSKYKRHLRSESLQQKQHATALYIIDNFALRAGNETKEEKGTVGCCTLRGKHIRLMKNNMIELNFYGKDSIRYKNKVKVSGVVFDNLNEFKNEAKGGSKLFSQVTTNTLNEYLNGLMPGLTAKVFRTFKATECFQQNIERFTGKLRGDVEQWELLIAFKKANLEVAKLLNHRVLTGNKARKKAITKLENRIKAMKGDIKRLGRGGGDRKIRLQNNVKKRQAELDLKKKVDNYALNTSKQNYISPRAVIRWCRDNDIEEKEVYTKAQLKKFNWAIREHQRMEFE